MVANNPVPALGQLPDGTVLRCVRELSGKHYTYILLKVDKNHWYVTGFRDYRTLREMRRWFAGVEFAAPHEIATGWHELALLPATEEQ